VPIVRLVFLRAFVVLAFGVAVFAWPEPTVQVLVVLLGAFLILFGLVTLWEATSWQQTK
jgi:uncharacterized membrane protein HdeD (DUF308 family)